MTLPSQLPSDSAAVHRGLLAIAREHKADFNAILAQYAIERLIARLSRSAESPRFVLKGAMLFRIWTGNLHRPTKDVDFLGHGAPSPAVVADAVRTIISVEIDDGLTFTTESIFAGEIREEQDYAGVRVTVTAYLAHVPITVRIDVGFGDAITPAAAERRFPTWRTSSRRHVARDRERRQAARGYDRWACGRRSGEFVQIHDDREPVQGQIDELPVIDIHSL